MAESELTTLNGPLPIVHWIVQGWRRVESKWWSCCGAGTVAGWLWHRWDILTTFCIHLLNEWEKMTQVIHTSFTPNSDFLATGTSWVNSTPRHMIIDWEKYTIVFWCRTSSSTPSVTTNFPSGENYNHQFSKWNQLCFRDLRMLLKSTDIAMSKARHPSLLPRWQSIIKYHQLSPGGKILSKSFLPFIQKKKNNHEQAFLPLLPLWDGAHQVGLLQWQVPHPEPGRQGDTELHLRSQDAVPLWGDLILWGDKHWRLTRRAFPCTKKRFSSTQTLQWDSFTRKVFRYFQNVNFTRCSIPHTTQRCLIPSVSEWVGQKCFQISEIAISYQTCLQHCKEIIFPVRFFKEK